MGFLSVLTIILLILKAIGLLSISWFLVFLPVIIAVAIPIILLIATFIVALITD